jgi:hypothetical protein
MVSLNLKFRQARQRIAEFAISLIAEEKFLIPFLYLCIQKFSKNYLSGGIFGYKYFHSGRILQKIFDRSIFRAFMLISFDKRNKRVDKLEFPGTNESTTYFSNIIQQSYSDNRDKLNQLRILSLLPSGWARTKNEMGFPHAYHLSLTARQTEISYFDLPTKAISANPRMQVQRVKEREWQEVEDLVDKYSINTLLVSGHKRSFDPVNKQALGRIKAKYDVKVLLLMLDDWSNEYLEVVENFGNVIDKVLVYDKECIVANSISTDRYLLWPFPRYICKKEKSQNSTSENIKIKFIGSAYLNRMPWLTLLKKLSTRYPNLNLDLSTAVKTGQYSLTAGQYLDLYCQSDLTIHFLERTPGVFTFTSSLWDAFAERSLVIAQVGSDHDPIAAFFRPGLDYLPFQSIPDLQEIVYNLNRFPESIKKISTSGHKFMLDNYNPHNMFNYLADALF